MGTTRWAGLVALGLLLVPAGRVGAQDDSEAQVVKTLRGIWKAQERFIKDAGVDVNGDGRPEYGCLQELAGVLPVRTAADGTADGSEPLEKPRIPAELGAVDGSGRATAHGYYFQVWLPDTTGGAVHEAPGMVAEGEPIDAGLAALCWAGYAWPRQPGFGKTFVINQFGDVRATKGGAYGGKEATPAPDAAFVGDSKGIHRLIAVDAQGHDGRTWSRHTRGSVPTMRALLEVQRYEDRLKRERVLPEEPARKMGIHAVAAISTLRNLSSSQAQFQATAKADVDNDGTGEFGVFQELCGRLPVRTEADGTSDGERLSPAILSRKFWSVTPEGHVVRMTYRFRIWLPDAEGNGVSESPDRVLAEDSSVDSDLAETTYCVYAWPDSAAAGRMVFCVNQSGDIVGTRTDRYVGGDAEPLPGAAFSSGGERSIVAMLAVGEKGQDGLVWEVANPQARRTTTKTPAERAALERIEREAGLLAEKGPLAEARRDANEISAISTLRNISSSQAQFQATAMADVDNDGTGEFGVFQELSGAMDIRTAEDGTHVDGRPLTPPILSGAFRTLDKHGNAIRSGYCFRIYLPDPKGNGVAEVADRSCPDGATIDSDLAETTWCMYAWPEKKGSGERVFFVNQMGDILGSPAGSYIGSENAPAPAAAFLDASEKGRITGRAAAEREGQDGVYWKFVN